MNRSSYRYGLPVLALALAGVAALLMGADPAKKGNAPSTDGKAAASAKAPPPSPAWIKKLIHADASDAEFEKTAQQARSAGVPEQYLLEARLVRAMKAQDTEALARLAPAFERVAPAFDLPNSEVFGSEAEFRGLRSASGALAARQKGDAAGFERGMKEAFWANPENADLYARWVLEAHKEKRLAESRLPMDLPLKTAEGGTVTLAQLAAGKKAVLVDFWASWCGPCMALIPEYKAKAAKLAPQGIVVAGMNTEASVEIAAQVKKEQKIATPWLVEPASEPYSRALKIDSIPQMALVTPEGKVLYTGHPMDPGLERALATLDVKL